jgi:heme-degrading monooxygenase HmoA
MFARHLTFNLKPNAMKNYTLAFEKEVTPVLRKQAGFRDLITLADENGMDVTAISLWETKEQAVAFGNTTYPSILKTVEKFLDGPPKVRVLKVVNSTAHKLTATTEVAA